MFHIFSPLVQNRKAYSKKRYKDLKKEYANRVVYYQFDINISSKRFVRILNQFERNKFSAKQYYGHELRRELERIVTQSIARL